MEDQKDNSVDVDMVAFWVDEGKLLLPCTDNVPESFTNMFENVDYKDAVLICENEVNAPVDMIIGDITVLKYSKNHM
jgi:hypothetical protein